MKTSIRKILYAIFLFGATLFSQTQLPDIFSVTPLSGVVGTSVTVYGSYFYFGGIESIAAQKKNTPIINRPPADYCAVYFGSYQVIPTSLSTTHIVFTVPSVSPGNYAIRVVNTNGSTTFPTSFTVTTPPVVNNLAFLHGMGQNSASWYSTPQNLYNQYNVSSYTNRSYDGLGSISTTATNYASYLIPSSNSIVIGHSMGGVLAREIKRQGLGGNMKALISIGSPHQGAPIAQLAPTNMNNLGAEWVYDMAIGWYYFYYAPAPVEIATAYLGPILDLLNITFESWMGTDQPAAVDLRPNSTFMNTLNANPTSTLPSVHYAIYGREDWLSHWRMAEAYNNSGIDGGNYVSTVNDIKDYYVYIGLDQAWWGDYYYEEWEYTWDPYYWDLANYYYSVADAFFYGAYSISNKQQQQWNLYLVGEAANVGSWDPVNDAFIPVYSQAPSFVIAARQIPSLHTNHAEETAGTDAVNAIKNALQRQDIGLQPR